MIIKLKICYMKKIYVLFVLLIVGIIVSGFDLTDYHSESFEKGNDFIYYTCVKAWTEATESQINYIYYKEGNGVRKYYCTCDDTQNTTCLLYVKKNPLYKNEVCDDFRKNYKYCTYWGDPHYFNCDLPLFVE